MGLALSTNNLKTIETSNRQDWRNWLQTHHDSEREIWLIFHKGRAADKFVSYGAAVEEALCFGWVDSLVSRFDDDRYARKFTPRKPDSKWSTSNRERYAKLNAQGLLAAPGLDRLPTKRNGDAPRRSPEIPAYIEKEVKAHARARAYFLQLAPSDRRLYVSWIDSAKREETKERRLREAISLLEAGKKLGLK